MAEMENKEEKPFLVLSFHGVSSWDGEQGGLEYKIKKMNCFDRSMNSNSGRPLFPLTLGLPLRGTKCSVLKPKKKKKKK